MKRWSAAHPFAVFAAVGVALIVIAIAAVWLIDPRYQFNDDMIIAAIASGEYTGVPDPRTIYGGAIFSTGLAALSGIWAGVPWFLIVCVLCSVISFSLIVFYLAVRLRELGRNYLIMLIPIVTVQACLTLWLVLVPSYSAAAATAATGSLGVLYLYLQRTRSVPWLAALIGSSVLFALGWGIRENGFPLFGVFVAAAPAVLLMFWRLRWARAISLAAVWSAFILLERLVERSLYRSELWSEPISVIDRLNLIWSGYVFGSIVPIGLAQGWSGAEVGLMQYLTPVPSSAFSLASLQGFIDAAQIKTVGVWAVAPPSIEAVTNSFFGNRYAFMIVALLATVYVFFLVAIKHTRPLPWVFLAISVACTVGLIVFLSLIRNNTGHVTLPLTASAMTLTGVAITFLVSENRSVDAPNFRPLLVATAIVGSAAFLLVTWSLPFGVGNSVSELSVKKLSWQRQQQIFEAIEPGCLVLGANIGAEIAPANRSRDLWGAYPVVQLGWVSLSPHTDARLRELGFDSWESLFEQDRCTYFFGGAEHAAMITQTIQDNYGIEGGFSEPAPDSAFPTDLLRWQGRGG